MDILSENSYNVKYRPEFFFVFMNLQGATTNHLLLLIFLSFPHAMCVLIIDSSTLLIYSLSSVLSLKEFSVARCYPILSKYGIELGSFLYRL